MSTRGGNKKRTCHDGEPASSLAIAPAPSHAQVDWFLKICRGPSLCTVYVRDPETGLVPSATLPQLFASPRTGSLILHCLVWPCRKALTVICTALHRSTEYWSFFSERSMCYHRKFFKGIFWHRTAPPLMPPAMATFAPHCVSRLALRSASGRGSPHRTANTSAAPAPTIRCVSL